MGFCNCITIHKGEKEGGEWRGSEVEFLHLGGKVIIVFSYISVERCRKG